MSYSAEVWVLVEGQTEELFVKRLLAPHLRRKNIFIKPELTETRHAQPRRDAPAYRGGVVSYGKVRNDILRLIKSKEKAAMVTTMIDFDKLEGKDFPDYTNIPKASVYEQVAYLEKTVQRDIAQSSNREFQCYFAVHAYEAMLFADAQTIIDQFPELSTAVKAEILKVRPGFESPEHINRNQSRAKRITDLGPRYDKRLHGLSIAEKIGLPAIRAECVHFDKWLTRLEGLAVG